MCLVISWLTSACETDQAGRETQTPACVRVWASEGRRKPSEICPLACNDPPAVSQYEGARMIFALAFLFSLVGTVASPAGAQGLDHCWIDVSCSTMSVALSLLELAEGPRNGEPSL